jgi:hypothetical protein
MVDMSATMSPGFAPAKIPRSPRATATTSGESGTIVMTISLSAATAAGLSPRRAPAPTTASTLVGERL